MLNYTVELCVKCSGYKMAKVQHCSGKLMYYLYIFTITCIIIYIIYAETIIWSYYTVYIIVSI